MSEQRMQAKRAYDTFCQMLDNQKWKYERNNERLELKVGVEGQDFPFTLLIKVDEERFLLSIYCYLDVNVKERRGYLDMAVGVSAVNMELINGGFDYDFQTGKLMFRVVNSYKDSVISKEVYEYMLRISCQTIDQYNDKFILLASGNLSLEEFLAKVK